MPFNVLKYVAPFLDFLVTNSSILKLPDLYKTTKNMITSLKRMALKWKKTIRHPKLSEDDQIHTRHAIYCNLRALTLILALRMPQAV